MMIGENMPDKPSRTHPTILTPAYHFHVTWVWRASEHPNERGKDSAREHVLHPILRLRRSYLSPRLILEATEMISRILNGVSPIDDVEMFICY